MARRLQDWLSGFMAYTENSEPPVLFKKWVGISVIAACLQRKCIFNWGSLKFYPNLYIVLVAPSGRCRKGTAMGPGYDLLVDRGIKMSAEAITREALIRELANSKQTEIDSRGRPIMHCSLTVFSQELTVFLGYNNAQLMSDLTDWYDCKNRWTYRTKNVGTDEVHGVWVNLIGATTPELVQSALPRDAIGGGLTSRMIFVYEDQKSKLCPAPFLSPEDLAIRDDLQIDLESISLLSGTFQVTKEYINRWVDWYTEEATKRRDNANLAGYYERRPNHIIKLSMILNASRSDDMIIDVNDLNNAIELLDQTEKRMPETFSGVGKNESADTIDRVMKTIAMRKSISLRDLMRAFYQDADKETLAKILGTIEAMGFCRLVTTGKDTFVEFVDKGARK